MIEQTRHTETATAAESRLAREQCFSRSTSSAPRAAWPSVTSRTRSPGARERDQRRHRVRVLTAHDVLHPGERVRDGLPRGLRHVRQLVPSDSYYAHDDWDRRTENVCPEDMEVGNGHAHCMAMLLGTAGESIPVQRRQALARPVAARDLHRARPRARPAVDRPGRRHVIPALRSSEQVEPCSARG